MLYSILSTMVSKAIGPFRVNVRVCVRVRVGDHPRSLLPLGRWTLA